MSEHIAATFAAKEKINSPVFVTFITAGYPSIAETVPLMLAMEKGGADVIELGVPFTDPMADGKAIQDTNNVALEQGVDYKMCLGFVKEARNKGLQAPVILDEQALRGFRACTEEGIIPALETAHAVWATIELAKTMPKDAIGRGDKDVSEILEILPQWADKLDWHIDTGADVKKGAPVP